MQAEPMIELRFLGKITFIKTPAVCKNNQRELRQQPQIDLEENQPSPWIQLTLSSMQKLLNWGGLQQVA